MVKACSLNATLYVLKYGIAASWVDRFTGKTIQFEASISGSLFLLDSNCTLPQMVLLLTEMLYLPLVLVALQVSHGRLLSLYTVSLFF